MWARVFLAMHAADDLLYLTLILSPGVSPIVAEEPKRGVVMRGWKRLGVVLSVVCFAAFGLWLRHESQEQAWIASGHRTCGYEADASGEGWRRANPHDLERPLNDGDEWQHECERTASEVVLERTGTVWDHVVVDARSIAIDVASGGRALRRALGR